MISQFPIQLPLTESNELRSIFNDLIRKHNGDMAAVVNDAAQHPTVIHITVGMIDSAVANYQDNVIYDFLTKMYDKD